MTLAYLGHRYWSFSHRARTGVKREYLLFAVINGATLLLGLGIVAFVRYPLGQESALVLQIANVFSTILGTVIRYLSYRRWVFPAHGQAEDGDLAGAVAPVSMGAPQATVAVPKPLPR
jgi:putative flippase GtrA